LIEAAVEAVIAVRTGKGLNEVGAAQYRARGRGVWKKQRQRLRGNGVDARHRHLVIGKWLLGGGVNNRNPRSRKIAAAPLRRRRKGVDEVFFISPHSVVEEEEDFFIVVVITGRDQGRAEERSDRRIGAGGNIAGDLILGVEILALKIPERSTVKIVASILADH